MKACLATAAGFVAVAAGLAGARPAQEASLSALAPRLGPPGRIAFIEPARGHSLVTIRADGTQRRVLTRPAYVAFAGFSFSPSARGIVFALAGKGLRLVSVRGGAIRPLTGGPDGDPAWSPDGSWIAFVRRLASSEDALFVIHPDGSGLQQISSDAALYRDIVWAPDSRRLAASAAVRADANADASGCTQIAVVRIGQAMSLLTGPPCAEAPAWSPDGNELAFNGFDRQATSTVTVMVERPDGSGLRSLTNEPGNSGPRWSPNGRSIGFTHYDARSGLRLVETIGPDGRGLRQITPPRGWNDDLLGWSPDSRWLLFQRSDPVEDFGVGELFLIGAGGSRLRRVDRTEMLDVVSLGDGASWSHR